MDARPIATLLAGDLNSDSTDAALRLITMGHVGADDGDFATGLLRWSPSSGLEDSARQAARIAAAQARRSQEETSRGARDSPAAAGEIQNGELETEAGGGVEVGDALHDAQALALRFHRLRRALATVSEHAAGEDSSSDEAAAALAVVRDHEAGRTLLTSEALASAEVALQMGSCSLSDAKTADTLRGARDRLREMSIQLDEAVEKLRAIAAAEVAEAGPTGEDALPSMRTAQALARSAGSAILTQPTPLQSAYGLNTQPTHAVNGYMNALDWICFDPSQLAVRAVAPLPTRAELTRDVAMPSEEFPSDHVALCCELAWRDTDLLSIVKEDPSRNSVDE